MKLLINDSDCSFETAANMTRYQIGWAAEQGGKSLAGVIGSDCSAASAGAQIVASNLFIPLVNIILFVRNCNL
jgi:hypothetical protein